MSNCIHLSDLLAAIRSDHLDQQRQLDVASIKRAAARLLNSRAKLPNGHREIVKHIADGDATIDALHDDEFDVTREAVLERVARAKAVLARAEKAKPGHPLLRTNYLGVRTLRPSLWGYVKQQLAKSAQLNEAELDDFCARVALEALPLNHPVVGVAGKNLAARFRSKLVDELAKGRMNDPIDKPWSEFVEEFMAVQRAKKRPKTVLRYDLVLRGFAGICQPASVLSVTPQMVEQYVTKRVYEVRPATLNSDLGHLHAAMEKAKLWYHLPSNPVGSVDRLKVVDKELRVLGVDEVDRLLKTCREIPNRAHALRWEGFIYLALTCGLRRGELLNLRWQDVDVAGHIIRLTCRDEWQTKSGKNRVAFLDDHAACLLESIRQAQTEMRRLSPLIFVSDSGETWGYNLSRDFQWLVKRSELPYFTLHDLRRTFCSALANANVQEALVQKLAGHASMATTLKFYTKVSLEAARNATQALPYRIEESAVSQPTHYPNRTQALKEVS